MEVRRVIGRVLNQVELNKDFVQLELLIEDGSLRIVSIENDGENYLGKYVSILTKITKLSNANFGHVYPEGTIGTF